MDRRGRDARAARRRRLRHRGDAGKRQTGRRIQARFLSISDSFAAADKRAMRHRPGSHARGSARHRGRRADAYGGADVRADGARHAAGPPGVEVVVEALPDELRRLGLSTPALHADVARRLVNGGVVVYPSQHDNPSPRQAVCLPAPHGGRHSRRENCCRGAAPSQADAALRDHRLERCQRDDLGCAYGLRDRATGRFCID